MASEQEDLECHSRAALQGIDSYKESGGRGRDRTYDQSIKSRNNGYDGSGNQICDTDSNGGTRNYSYDAEGRLLSIAMSGTSTPFETYTYSGDGNRVRKDNADGSYREYVYFNGQPIAEKDQTGAWTDYIYANGQKIARTEPYDVRAHLSGDRVDASQSDVWGVYVLPVPSPGYVVKPGDMLAFRMYQHNAHGGISVGFTDGSNSDWYCGGDQNGDCLQTESRSDQWVNRVSNLGSIAAGKTISYIFVEDTQGAPQGKFDVMVADMTITSSDGTVTPIVGRGVTEQTIGPTYNCNQVNSTWPVMCAIERVTDPNDFAGPPSTVRYMLSDHLGSAQLELTAGGWPVWKGEFTPFGQELDTQYTANNYKFAGMEHDPESGLDHTQFRQYASVTGRWLSPDPYNGSYDLSNPQTFNRYSYVGNMPMSFTDPMGLLTDGSGGKDPYKLAVEIGETAVGVVVGYAIVKGIKSLINMFDTPNCHACDHPRPGTGIGQWDGNFGESLGLPVNGPQLGGGGVGGFFGIPSGCEFGPCDAGPSDFTGNRPYAGGGPIIVTPPQWLLSFLTQFTTASGNALHAPPLKINSGVCSIYGDRPYLGAGLQCVCQSAGDSPWSQDTRGALAADQKAGISDFIGHGTSYAGSTIRTRSLPAPTLGKAYWSCKRW